jgi:hypothetical protein
MSLDNKLAMKLFGSKKALMNERLRQKESGLFIIHPCSTFRLVINHAVQSLERIHYFKFDNTMRNDSKHSFLMKCSF